MTFKILTINPGSTSTKIGLFANQQELKVIEVSHNKQQLLACRSVYDQIYLRRKTILDQLNKFQISLSEIDCFVGRGGLLRPLPGGIYLISDQMLLDLKAAQYGDHPCNLGAVLAHEFGIKYDKPCFVVDPPTTDELMDMARVTGLPQIKRRSLVHALSQRGIARLVADKLNIEYEQGRFIVAHLGGGISIAAHKYGRMVDVVNAYDGEGPFSPERSGALPLLDLLSLVDQGQTTEQLRKIVTSQSGLWAYIGSADLQLAQQQAQKDEGLALVLQAMAYNICKSITQLLPALSETNQYQFLDALIITGGMAHSDKLVLEIKNKLAWLGKVFVFPKTCEMQALAMGGLLVLQGEIQAKNY